MKLVSSNYSNINAPALLLPERNTSWHLLLDDIIGIEALSNYSRVYCRQRNAPIVVAKTLKWFEERLESTLFTRVHHGYLVNNKHVLSVNGNQLKLGNGALIPISRRKKTAVERALRA